MVFAVKVANSVGDYYNIIVYLANQRLSVLDHAVFGCCSVCTNVCVYNTYICYCRCVCYDCACDHESTIHTYNHMHQYSEFT